MKAKRIVTAIALALLVCAAPAQAIYQQAWVATYDGPAGGIDEARAVATDASGNALVTGYSQAVFGDNRDFITIKYAPDGTELWAARYDGPASDTDEAAAVAVDASGNAIVTGGSYNPMGSSWDYATIKYAPDGTELWVALYNAPYGSADEANDVAVDSSGNVYVTGQSYGSGTNLDYATVAYDPDGNELWTARYNGPDGLTDRAKAVALDPSSGNVYVTGESRGSSTLDDMATVAYDSDGNELWSRRRNGAGNGEDEGTAVAVDGLGRVIASGFLTNAGSETDGFVIAYDASGNELWTRLYDGPNGLGDYFEDVAADATGNVFVAGFSQDAVGGEDYLTVAYDSDGNELWDARYRGSAGNELGEGFAIALSVFGDVITTGTVAPDLSADYDYATVLYDADGHQRWDGVYDGPAAGGFDMGIALAVDSSGNLFVTGDADVADPPDGPLYDIATIKYEPCDCGIDGGCQNDGEADPAIDCRVCDPSQDRFAWTPVHARCDDSDVCTSDYCVPDLGGCLHGYTTEPCDDGDLCTENDACAGGVCAGTEKDCDDADLCTTDSCMPATGLCSNDPVVCEDGNACTDDSCNPGTGDCVFANNSAACNDGVYCNGPDTCADGSCSIHDGNPCKEGQVCDEELQFCDEETAVELVSFEAEEDEGAVLLEWVTATETGCAGFALWRSESTEGGYARITPSVIPSEGDPLHGATYLHTDAEVEAGSTYWYKLEEIGIGGNSAFYGPAEVTLEPESLFGCGMIAY